MIEEGKGKALEIVGLNYEINETRILNDISLSAARGEFIGLIGPNGAGKSTLLKCINGICSASGKVTVCGTPLESLDGRAMARRISLMHQNTEITFPFPSLDIVMMGRYPHLKRMQGESRGDLEIAKRNMKYTDTLQFENKPVTQLSGGERQRVLFAKILTQEADIVLLDEPTASLDISYQEQIFNFSGELVSSGKTVIAAVHDLKTASRYCSRLILINRGSVMADGTPEEVLTRENISAAYGVNILVYRNKVTGQLDFHLYKGSDYNLKGPIHVIGGGGSASWVIRQLSEEGYSVSAGVFAPEDSDRQSADVFGAEYITSKPFSDISDESYSKNLELIEKSNITILCNMPFGRQNLKNLEAASHARKLVIIEDDPPEVRDFTGGQALKLYKAIRENAIVTSSARLYEVL